MIEEKQCLKISHFNWWYCYCRRGWFNLEKTSLDDLGEAKKVEIGKENTIISMVKAIKKILKAESKLSDNKSKSLLAINKENFKKELQNLLVVLL